MTTDIFSREGVTDADPGEKARAAVKVFRSMQPTLSAYARALTGKPNVRVEISPHSNGMTDGKRIFFRPPIALGDQTPHERRLCDKRDENKQQLCKACAIRESVLITIYHEIGHITEDTFATTSEKDKAALVAAALDQVDKKYAKAVRARVEGAPDYLKDSYLGMARLVSPFLPGIVNALDDARVNRGVYTARKGTKAMFEADTYRIFNEGVEQRDDEGNIITKMWNTYPLNMQAAVALYCKASGYDISDWFVKEVVDAMEDEQIKSIMRDFNTVRHVSGVYAMSIPLLVRLRELGFFTSPTDPQDEDEDNGESADSSGEPSTSESGTGDNDEPGSEAGSDSDPQEGSGSETSEGKDGEQEEDSGDGNEDAKPEDSGPSKPDEVEAGSQPDPNEEEDNGNEALQADGEPSDDGSSESEDSEDAGDGGKDESQDPSEGDGTEEGELGDETGAGSSETSEGPKDASESGEGSEGSGIPENVEPQDLDGGDDSDAGTGSDNSRGSSGEGSSLGDQEDLDDTSSTSEDQSGDSSGEHLAEPNEEVSGESDVQQRDDSGPDSKANDEETSSDPIDTGADEGLGGIEIIEDSAFDRLPMGTPEEVEGAVHEIAHPEERPESIRESSRPNSDLERAVVQGVYFETPSRNVFGVREHHYGQPIVQDGYNMSSAWRDIESMSSRRRIGMEGDFDCPESILGPALLRMRVAFADNKRGKDIRNKKSGRVDSRVLGKRAYHGDERMFKARFFPGKKDYFVVIGVDISGSTIGLNLALAKKMAMAQAELCNRMGIKFAMYCHSGKDHNPGFGRYEGIDLDIYVIKEPDEPWTDNVKKRLTEIGSDSQNLDGHTFEYYRKILDSRPETDKVMLYYTDGKMPAENHDEELEILTREIRICRQKRYVLVGVGIRTDSPRRHGLDTVRVDGEEDVVKVVKHLEKRLLEI